ncbi:hypothetical protein CGLO_05255 [Colletotrichum gloeosporioides Cg-14]|uniref:Uncharacterized protein n=1 Tax=Colletotrichum gloeosporioides (strain Cg-14) TaxID=1237896 RepID=T0LSY9_COLGC|nr:hypothetical protein CGLO_05255 [Colletotrichum gloeosporioides Cg-14]
MSQLAIINMDPTQRAFGADAAPTCQESHNNMILLSREPSSLGLNSQSPRQSTGTKRITKTYAGCVDLPQELILDIIGCTAENYGKRSSVADKNAKDHRVNKVVFEGGLQFPVWHDLVSLAASCKPLYHRMTPTIYNMNVEHANASALVPSAKYGSLDGMMWALENGADVNQTELLAKGVSPLFFALIPSYKAADHLYLSEYQITRQQCRKAVRMLINAGSSLITHRTLGVHALHQACDVKDWLGNSPLYYFALDGFEGYDDPEELIGLMVQHGADVDATNYAGYTPLYYALAFWDDGHHLTDRTDHLVALLKAGAYLLPECKDLRGKVINSDRYNDARYVNRLISKAMKLAKRHAIRFDGRKLPTMEEIREKQQMVVLTTFYHCCELPEEYQVLAVKEFTDELSKDEWRDYWVQRSIDGTL